MLDRPGVVADGNTKTVDRAAFIEKVWEWKAESGGTITRQLRRLGASLDWPRERFTMDEGLSAAVRKVFVELHRQGLIYRDKRLVNWDPKLHTAISDLEVEQREVKGHLWHFRYPVEGMDDTFVTVATTRPETMLGDTGVAVHPDDPRFRDLVGRNVVLPLVGRAIPIVADEYADPETGTGAVKITPPTTSTISRSAGATSCRRSTSSTPTPACSTRCRSPIAGSTATRRGSASSPTWRRSASSRRSSRTPTSCPMATAAASPSSRG